MRTLLLRRSIFVCFAMAMIIVGFVVFVVATDANSEQGAMVECGNHLRALSLGIDAFRSHRNRFPPGTIIDEKLPPEKRWSWYTILWEYLDGNPPGIPDRDLPWDARENLSLTYFDKVTGETTNLKSDETRVFLCPNARIRSDSRHYGLASYVGVAGLGNDAAWLPVENPRAGIFGYRGGTRTDQVKDGLATTSMIIETASQNGPWRAAGVSTMRGLDGSRQPYLGIGRQFGGLHKNGVFVAFADGSVRFVSDEINPKVFEAMSTIAGGEQTASDSNIKP
jgi:hypothetical protein